MLVLFIEVNHSGCAETVLVSYSTVETQHLLSQIPVERFSQ